MAVDSKQKRMSAFNHRCPWRGPMVDPTEAGFDAGNRQAAAFQYSGIAAGVIVQYNIICFTSEDLAVGSFSSEAITTGSFTTEAFGVGGFSSESFVECP